MIVDILGGIQDKPAWEQDIMNAVECISEYTHIQYRLVLFFGILCSAKGKVCAKTLACILHWKKDPKCPKCIDTDLVVLYVYNF